MGRRSRRRDRRFCRVRLCDSARRVPDPHRPVVPRDARARRSARATGREAGTAAPGAGGSDRELRRLRPYDREIDLLGPMLRNERRITVRSGSLIVGLLSCSTHGPETWSWALTGVARPDDRLRLARRRRDPNGCVRRDRGGVGGMALLGRSRIDSATGAPMMLRRPAGFIAPCLPSKAARPPSGPLWVHEIKHDGYRLMVRRDGARVRCFTKNGYDWADRFPAIVDAALRIKASSFLIDGEAVIARDDGMPDFRALRSRAGP